MTQAYHLQLMNLDADNAVFRPPQNLCAEGIAILLELIEGKNDALISR